MYCAQNSIIHYFAISAGIVQSYMYIEHHFQTIFNEMALNIVSFYANSFYVFLKLIMRDADNTLQFLLDINVIDLKQ